MNQKPSRSEADTRARLLDAAERLFGDQGFRGASLRAITAEAHTNLAAVNYHFGTKEALLGAVLARRIEPLTAERLQLLDEAEARARKGAPSVAEILNALIAPLLRLSRDECGSGFVRLSARMHSESGDLWERFYELFRPTRERFSRTLARALPGLSPARLAWRLHFVIGTAISLMGDHHRLEFVSNGLCRSDDVRTTLDELLPFLEAGLLAPVPRARRRSPRR